METENIFGGIVILFVGIIIGGLVGTVEPLFDSKEVIELNDSITQLGNAICVAEHEKVFESYDSKIRILRCKTELIEPYDGINIGLR